MKYYSADQLRAEAKIQCKKQISAELLKIEHTEFNGVTSEILDLIFNRISRLMESGQFQVGKNYLEVFIGGVTSVSRDIVTTTLESIGYKVEWIYTESSGYYSHIYWASDDSYI